MPGNSFADSARAKKVAAMVRYFDRRFYLVGRNPHTDAAEIASMLRDSVSESEWAHHAIQAGQNKPSATTVALIIKVYEDRAAARAENVVPIRRFAGVN